MIKTKLKMQDILDKEFPITMRGYDPELVDEFLDEIIDDYEAMEQEISRLNTEILQLQDNSNKTGIIMKDTKPSADLLKRLSNLEKAVFGEEN